MFQCDVFGETTLAKCRNCDQYEEKSDMAAKKFKEEVRVKEQPLPVVTPTNDKPKQVSLPKTLLTERSQATEKLTVEEMKELIKVAAPGPWPEGWPWWENTKEAYRQLADEYISNGIEDYPADRFTGRGIVIAGGGLRYFPGVWVCVRMLRHLGCKLPVEIWYMGDSEMDPKMKELFDGDNVSFCDAKKYETKYPVRILAGWELKLYAIKHSRFKEVLFLDADNYPVIDPTFMFEEQEYKDFGAVLWPDYDNWILKPDVWDLFGIKRRHEPAIESGQVMVNKARCWKETCLALWYGEHSDYVFHHVYGDKECFHLAWRKLNSYYGIPSARPGWNVHTIQQHDFQGRHLFYHRCQDKLRLDGNNRWLDDTDKEKECQEFLAYLRDVWSGVMWQNTSPTDDELAVIKRLTGRRYTYRRVGYDERILELLPNGRTGVGGAECERRWDVHLIDGKICLMISGIEKPTCQLTEGEDSVWRGVWLIGECMPIELVPLENYQVSTPVAVTPRRPNGMLMAIGIDIDQTLNKFPNFFTELGRLFKAAGHTVYIITGLGKDGAVEKLRPVIATYGDGFYDRIIDTSLYNADERKLIGKEDNEKIIGRFKQRMCKELGVAIMFDDKAQVHREFGSVPIFEVK